MSDNWRTHAKYWSSKYEVHAVDQRNHGKSFHSDDFDYTILVEDIVFYMNHHKINKAIILGHSMGGKTAMSLALKYPKRVEKLIVADIAPKKYELKAKFSNIINGLLNLSTKKFFSRNDADKALSKFISEAGIRQFLLKNFAWNEMRNLEIRCNISVLQLKLNEIGAIPLGDIYKGKTLFLAGKNSDYILKKDIDTINSIFPKSSITWIENAGHWLHAENPKAFTAAINKFLG